MKKVIKTTEASNVEYVNAYPIKIYMSIEEHLLSAGCNKYWKFCREDYQDAIYHNYYKSLVVFHYLLSIGCLCYLCLLLLPNSPEL